VAYRVVQWTTGTPSVQAHLVTLAGFVRDVPTSDVNAVPAMCAAATGFLTMADLPFVWNGRITSS
jgi:hypothetical protein